MATNHLKRINAPKTWPITRKETVFTLRPNPSGHPMHLSMPLSILLKDELQVVRTLRQVRTVLNTQELLVNGKRRRRPDDTAGLFDVVSFPAIKTSYRILISTKNRLYALPVAGDEANLIPSKVVRKTPVPGGKLQLGCHNGRTLLVAPKDAPAIGTTLMLTPDNTIKASYPLAEGAAVLIVGGKHVGKHGLLKEFAQDGVSVQCDDELVKTRPELLFAIGKGKPAIKITPAREARKA